MFRIGLTLALLSSVYAFGQSRGPRPARLENPGDFAFVRGEFGVNNRVVTSAPYSAQAVTQFAQALADGSHIQRSTTGSVVRDSEGRTRTERSVESIGALSASGNRAHTVFIQDSVAGVSYVLNPGNHTYRQMKARGPHDFGQARPRPQASTANVKREELGTQSMQGLTVQGKRITRTIAVGEAGNDRPIEVVNETWFSPDLQVVVMSKTSDPRFGETSYQLTNLIRAEPDHALFTVPAEYTLQQPGRPAPER